MTNTTNIPDSAGPLPSKFDAHYRQQLSALVDGELAADEARFMLRRLEHDAELSGCHERWQLLGDVLRGNACAPAPLDFSERVRQAVVADIRQNGAVAGPSSHSPRNGWKRWGGGAALAASVAMVAMFMTREQLPENSVPDAVIATVAELPAASKAPTVPTTNESVQAAVAVAPVVAAAVARRQDQPRRSSATRTQQAARSLASRQAEPQRAVAVQVPSMPATSGVRQDPFGHPIAVLPARPWPRSSVAPALSSSVFNASVPVQSPQTAFYPFEPRLPAAESGAGRVRDLLPRD
ncbi:MAG: RseA family anti-sigma factor [Stenotrophomonas sp.]